jgi:hypothetical protein
VKDDNGDRPDPFTREDFLKDLGKATRKLEDAQTDPGDEAETRSESDSGTSE